MLVAALNAATAAKEASEDAPAPREHISFVSMDMLLNSAANDDVATARCVAGRRVRAARPGSENT
jgi:hypothetical protein